MRSVNQSFLVLATVALVSTAAPSSFAQDHSHAGHDHAHADHDHAAHDHSGEQLAYRLPEWRAMHFDDPNKASQHATTVQRLGCEVRQGGHAGHIDVSYRCPDWKSLKVKDHQFAEQWANWLVVSGFDVSHSHTDPTLTQGNESVEFRMTQWKTLHGDGSAAEKMFVEQVRRLGCEVRVDQHAGHSDIRITASIASSSTSSM